MATSNTTLRHKLNSAFEEALALHGDLLCDGCFRPGGPKESKKAPKLSSPVVPSVVGQKILNLWSAEELHNNSLLQGKVNLFSNGTEDFLLSHSYKRVVETSSDKKQSSTLLALLQNKPSDRLIVASAPKPQNPKEVCTLLIYEFDSRLHQFPVHGCISNL